MKRFLSSIFFCGVFLFWVFGLVIVIFTDQLKLHKQLNTFNSSFFDFVIPYATNIGDGLFAIFLVGVLYFVNKKYSLLLLISFLISSGIAQFIKMFVYPNAMRPSFYFQNDDCFHFVSYVVMHTQNSFPSGHATTCFVIFTTFSLFWRDNKKLQALFVFSSIFFALTRVYLSQHFLEDVLVGSLIGTVTGAVVGLYIPKINFVKKLG
jgi:membrane-associated phospholipid phosphatase